jgi:hypothetical protein
MVSKKSARRLEVLDVTYASGKMVIAGRVSAISRTAPSNCYAFDLMARRSSA